MRGKRGFTLIEMLVALAILATVMGTVLALHGSGIRAVAAAEATARATVLARGLLEEVGFPQGPRADEGMVDGSLAWRRSIVRENPEVLPDDSAVYRVTVVVEASSPAPATVRLVTLRFAPVGRVK